MRTIKQLFMLLAVVTAFTTSCKKDEVEKDPFDTLDFKVSPEEASVNQKVEFAANNSTLGTEYVYHIEGGDINLDTLSDAGVVSFKFKSEGDYTVSLSVDGRKADASHIVNVSATNYKSAMKLWVSTLAGNIFAIDLGADEIVAEDTYVKAGTTAMTIKWANDKLYVFDAGVRLGWSGTSDYTGDAGSIKTFDPASYTTSTIITFTEKAYDDAYFGFVDANAVYWSDRNYDVTGISVDSKDKVFTYSETHGIGGSDGKASQGQYNSEDYPAMWTGADMGTWFGIEGYAYNGGVQKVGDLWYVAQTSHASGGLYTIQDQDGTYSAGTTVLSGWYVGDFFVTDSKIYFVSLALNGINEAGIYMCDLDGSNITLIDDTARVDLASSGVWAHSSLSVDVDGGIVYWTHRADNKVNPDDKSGIKAANLDGSDVRLVAELKNAIGLALAPVYE